MGHAATAASWLSIAAIFLQPSIQRNLTGVRAARQSRTRPG
jgi:hypothetical protein